MSTTARRSVATSLERLGTETAFSVLARAKALEREGRDVIHLEIGEPDFPTPLHICDVAAEALRAGETHYCPSAGIPELREAAAEYLSATRGVDVGPENVLVGTGAKPFLFFGILATCNPGDEVVYPGPGFPIYESAIRWVGSDAGSASAPRGARLHVLARGSRRAPRPEDEARHPQLPAEPDRWSTVARGRRERRRADRGDRRVGALGRGLLADALRGRVREHRVAPGDARADDSSRRALEDLRDDGLALRVRRGSRRARGSAHALLRELDVVRAGIRPARRRRRAAWAAGRAARDGRGVPRAPLARRRRPEPSSPA